MSKQTIFAFLGPSGVGKTTLCEAVRERLSSEGPGVEIAVSTTTRQPRPGEVHGVDYHFITRRDAELGVAGGLYIEHVIYDGHVYGYHADTFTDPLERGCDVFVVIERHGLSQLRDYFSGEVAALDDFADGVDVFAMLILPPSTEALAQRLREGGRTEEEAARRLQTARSEMYTDWSQFDAVVVNDDLEHTVRQITALVRHKRERGAWLDGELV